ALRQGIRAIASRRASAATGRGDRGGAVLKRSPPMRPFVLAATFAATLVAFTGRARAEEPESDEAEKPLKPEAPTIEPAGPACPPPSARWGVIGVGLATTAFFYGAAAGMSYAFPDAPGAHDLRTPIVGPWLAIAHNGCAADDTDCSEVWVVFRSIAT